jgi:formate/nitrite transporter FocA (FNT family)
MQKYLNSVLAGFLIGIGNLAIISTDRYVGAFLFSVALLSIIELQLPLYTGRIGKVLTNKNPAELLLMLCLNALGAMIPTGLFILMDPANLEKLQTVCSAKYSKSYLTLFAAGILCNVLIHIAVTAKRELITVLCIMCFILCTFEHSIADAGYLPVGGSILKWLVIVAGNTVGGIGTELLVRKESF